MRGPRLVVCLVLLCASALLAADRKTVVAVHFDGNRRFTEDFLREQVATKAGKPYDVGLVEQDKKTLRKFFAGVLAVDVKDVSGGVDVTFHVLDRILVGKVEFRGLSSVSQKDFQDLLATRAGRPLLDSSLAADKETIARKYREKGYHFVEVEVIRRPTARPDTEDVLFQVFPHERVRVKEVLLEGAASLKKADLLENVENSDLYRHTFLGIGKLLHPKYFDRTALEEDRRRIEYKYHQEGFLDARVVLEGIRFSDDREFATIHFRVSEGARYTLSTLKVVYGKGENALPQPRDRKLLSPQNLAQLAEISRGDPYREVKVEQTKREIERRLRAKAYAVCTVDVERLPDPKTKTVALTITIQTGVKVRLGRIRILGNTFTRDNVIRRAFHEGALPGEELNLDALEDARNRLANLRYFSSIRFGEGDRGGFGASPTEGLAKSVDTNKPNEYDVILQVAEMNTRDLQVGVGVNTDGGVSGQFTVSWRNFDITKPPHSLLGILDENAFRGGGQTFTLRAAPGTTFSSYEVNFFDPALRDSPWSFGFDVHRNLAFYEDFDQTEDGVSIRVGRFLDRLQRWHLQFEWSLRQILIENPQPNAPVAAIDAQGTSILDGIGLTLHYDSLRPDRYLVGFTSSATTQVDGSFLGGDFNLVKLQIEAGYGWRFFRQEEGGWHRLILRLHGSWVSPFGNTSQVPIYERYFAGGLNLRGFAYREVGPRSNGRPEGGNALLLMSADYVIPLTNADRSGFGLDLVFFLDQGIIDRRLADLGFEDWRISAGVGLAIAFGGPSQPPLQLNLGFPLRRRPGDQAQVVAFSLQRNF